MCALQDSSTTRIRYTYVEFSSSYHMYVATCYICMWRWCLLLLAFLWPLHLAFRDYFEFMGR
jgi:hypothetical protein